MSLVIAVDVDDTVANLVDPWLARYNRDFNDTLAKESITSWDIASFTKPVCGKDIYRYLDDPTLYDDVEPIPGALLAIDDMRILGHRVIFVTSAVQKASGRKLEWLRKHGFLSTLVTERVDKDYVECHDKSLVRADVLIDDRYENVKNFPGKAILFTQPWNAHETHQACMNGWDNLVLGPDSEIEKNARAILHPYENCGRKDDNGKSRFDLVPVRPLFYIADVFTRGAGKYEDHNWRKGLAWHRVFGALMRHALAWWAGEKLDLADGQHHLASVAWCSMVLMEYELTHPELDDRVCQTDSLDEIRQGKLGK